MYLMENKVNKRNYYSIAILICLLLIFSSNPFQLFIKDENIVYYIGIGLKVIFIVLMFIFIKKNELEMPKFKKLIVFDLMFIPFLILPFSNIIVELIKNTPTNIIDSTALIKALVFSILTAIVEEVTFRGTLLQELKKTESRFKTILISSLVFGLVHLFNISSLASIPYVLMQVAYSMYLGMILGLIYSISENIALPIIMHFVFNFINGDLASMLYSSDYDVLYFAINISIGFIIALYWLIVYTLFKIKEKNKDVTRDMDI